MIQWVRGVNLSPPFYVVSSSLSLSLKLDAKVELKHGDRVGASDWAFDTWELVELMVEVRVFYAR